MSKAEISAVLRALGGNDPDMPVVSEKQKAKDLDTAYKYIDRIRQMETNTLK